jgi:hypothetical protein
VSLGSAQIILLSTFVCEQGRGSIHPLATHVSRGTWSPFERWHESRVR